MVDITIAKLNLEHWRKSNGTGRFLSYTQSQPHNIVVIVIVEAVDSIVDFPSCLGSTLALAHHRLLSIGVAVATGMLGSYGGAEGVGTATAAAVNDDGTVPYFVCCCLPLFPFPLSPFIIICSSSL